MTSKFMKYGTMSPTNIKEEHEGSGFIDDSVIISDTAVNINSSELNDDVKYSTTTAVDSIKNDFMFCEVANNIVNENGEMKVEVDDIKIIFKSERLFCDYCREEYQGYCTKCGMLERILNGNMYNGAKDGIPNGILEIRYTSGCFGIYALKVIPDGVKFGPFTGLCTSEHSWRVKGGKLVLRDDKINNLNWMQYINSTDNTFKGNLLVLQCEGCLYYHSSREIQIGEELLVYFGKEYEVFPKENAQLEFNPASDWKSHDVFACTFCCLGFSSELFLLRHKTVCPYKVNANLRAEELMQCPSCKIYLEQKEYSEYHATCCHEEMNRQAAASPPVHQQTEVKGTYLFTSKGYKKRQQLLHKCDLCKYKTSYKSDLKAHANKHYEVKIHRCETCRRRYKTEEALRWHATNTHVKTEEGPAEEQSTCNADKRFACSKCDFKTKYKAILKEHGIIKHFDCKFKTNFKSYLRKHTRMKHLKDASHKRPDCPYATAYRSTLKTHIRAKHVNEKEYECAKCTFKTNYKIYLEDHVRARHDNVKDYKCAECAYATIRKSLLKRHVDVKHVAGRKYECADCGFETSYKSSLEAHLKARHLKEGRYKCEYRSACKGNLDKHRKASHANEKRNFKCTECECESSRKSLVDRHKKAKHLEVKSYKCAECSFETSYKISLDTHARTAHLKEGHYKCIECSYETGYKGNLEKHVKAKHVNEKKYDCADCAYKTSYKSALKRHVKFKHVKHLTEDLFKCSECAYETAYKSSLKTHVKVKHLNEKEYACAECTFKTNYRVYLEDHVKGKHANAKDYKCTECGYETIRRALLKRHVNVKHLQGKKYECAECEFKTSYKSSLKTHVIAKHVKEGRYKFVKCE